MVDKYWEFGTKGAYVYIPVKVPFIQLCLLDPRLVICSPPLCLHVRMCKPGVPAP